MHADRKRPLSNSLARFGPSAFIGVNRRFFFILAFALIASFARAEDWPEWRGKGRLGVWNETGIVETFPKEGLAFAWRTPVKGGYAGPAVAGGRVFVTDFAPTEGHKGIESALCLDEKTGKPLWKQEWDANYAEVNRDAGPRATPTVNGDRVYVLGSMGALLCLKVNNGEIAWKKNYVTDFGAQVPTWGMCGAPLVDGDRLICLVGGNPNAKVVAFDKMTGKEIWRALPSDSEPGYAQPVIYQLAGSRQLIIWHPKALTSLDPATGKINWEQPFEVRSGLTVATPVQSGNRVFVSSFYNGSLMLDTGEGGKPKVLWKGKSDSEIQTDGLHALNTTPFIKDNFIYGVCSYGQLRCLNADTGARVWETVDATEHVRWATAFIVRNANRFFLNNDAGFLIIAELTPAGYNEISRTKLIAPTTAESGRRQTGDFVNWSHPAYANQHIFARNDREIICASLAQK